MKKAVVTGGMGFIGSHLVDRLLADGYEVRVVDNLATGRKQNLKDAQGKTGLRIFEIDIAKDGLSSAFEGVEHVFHLAGLADIVPSIVKPLSYSETNIMGTIRVLEAARAAKAKKIVYAASSSCYGLATQFPTPETAAISPEYPYALSKWMGEEAVLHWGKIYQIPVVSLRLFNVYGLRSRTTGAYGAVFGVFLAQKLANKPLTIVGDGTQKRDFIYVTDVADAFATAAQKDAAQEVFNVGAGNPISVNELADLIGGPRTNIPKRPGEPDLTYADISKITTKLGWKPKVSFKKGVQMVLNRIEDWREAPVWTPESISEANKDWFQYLGGSSKR